MPRSTWVFASILSALVLGALGYLQWRETERSGMAARAEAADRAAELAAVRSTNEVLTAWLEAARGEIDELQQRIDEASRQTDDLEDRMRTELQSRDITISELQGSLTVDIVDRVLFDSGATGLKPEGQAILRRVAEVLSRYPGRQIQVIGHTDNIPIRGRTPAGYSDNWSLSAGRALAAVRFLHQEAGVDPARLAAVGCEEFRHLADNATAEGRARIRRIAVVVLPERVVPADLPPAAPPAPTGPGEDPETAGTVPPGPRSTTEPEAGTTPIPLPELPVPELVPVPGAEPKPDSPPPESLPEAGAPPASQAAGRQRRRPATTANSARPLPDQGTGSSSKIRPMMSSAVFSSASAS